MQLRNLESPARHKGKVGCIQLSLYCKKEPYSKYLNILLTNYSNQFFLQVQQQLQHHLEQQHERQETSDEQNSESLEENRGQQEAATQERHKGVDSGGI